MSEQAPQDDANPAPHPRTPIDRDAPCPACGYNLRGLTSDRCPECGKHIPEPIPPGQPLTLKQFLRGRDLRCKYCKYNLRDLESDTCPECGTRYYLAGGATRMDTKPAPMRPGEFAAGCLSLAAVPGVFLVLFRTAMGVWGGWLGTWTGAAAVVGVLVLTPLGLLVVMSVCRGRLNRLPPQLAWGVATVAVAGGVLAAVVGLLLVW